MRNAEPGGEPRAVAVVPVEELIAAAQANDFPGFEPWAAKWKR